ncbi:MAG: DUF120 domain-containing protein [Candidatus Thermoplasmatota archaeon]|nr:DUF120 domain-containing protein [Candidatus Thermoplasmatota archaeon]
MDDRLVLLELSHLGALERFVNITTIDMGELLGVSQQSASIYLNHLESGNLIERVRKKDGSSIRITKEGMDLLLGLYGQLRSVFDSPRRIDVKGHLSRGLGEGAYYLSQYQYKEQLIEYFNIDPFEGTLNVELSKRNSPVLDLLRKGAGVKISGFQSQGRSFGSCICYPCTVNGKGGVIMIPNRTLHMETLEVVSNVKLRDELNLRDGDDVIVSITFPVARKEQ